MAVARDLVSCLHGPPGELRVYIDLQILGDDKQRRWDSSALKQIESGGHSLGPEPIPRGIGRFRGAIAGPHRPERVAVDMDEGRGSHQRVIWKLKQWNRDPYIWKARASLVPFARSRYITRHQKEIAQFADMLIRREERFAKTAVGWVLREYSRHDPDFVLDFLGRHAKHITWEVKRNALKYYRKEKR